jgi:hypothetical protein
LEKGFTMLSILLSWVLMTQQSPPLHEVVEVIYDHEIGLATFTFDKYELPGWWVQRFNDDPVLLRPYDIKYWRKVEFPYEGESDFQLDFLPLKEVPIPQLQHVLVRLEDDRIAFAANYADAYDDCLMIQLPFDDPRGGHSVMVKDWCPLPANHYFHLLTKEIKYAD